MQVIDYTGKYIGDLHVICRHPVNTSYRAARWICHCICGNYAVVSSKELHSEKTKSCGHLRVTNVRKANTRHGSTLTPEYVAYNSAKNRCQNPKNVAYYRYGGAGITFGFTNYEHFHEVMGPRPSNKYSLDRWPNPRGNYEPGNVRWATKEQQARNRRCEHCDRRNNVLELSKGLGL
jgi:hypothetical protein